MRHFCAILLAATVILRGDFAIAKDNCTHAWGKGNFKTYKEVESELGGSLTNAKILRLSLCSAGNDHYFLATILESAGKVRVIRVPAR
jgi:hypothetical protein